MTQSNFFDAISVADMEKVHSAVIGWMLSDKCEAFGQNIRSKLLQQIFGDMESPEVYDHIEAFIEWNSIDILIITTEGKGDEEKKKCWVIENKIKSSQHSNQLDRYVDTICDEEQYQSYDKAYCFLTLIEEPPRCSKDVKWVNTRYQDLLRYFCSVSRLNSNKDGIILKEYFSCIKKLNDSLNDFLDHYTDYENVFNDGSLRKTEKLKKWANLDTICPNGKFYRYISDNGLETIFQKCFLATIVPKTSFKDLSYSISETRGSALVDFQYESIDEGRVKIGIQFQNGSFKVQILQEESSGQDFYEKWYNKTKEFIPQLKGNGEVIWTVNPSKNKAKPYLSISTQRDSEWFKGKIIDKWKDAYDACSNAAKEFIAKYKNGFFK